MGKVSKGCVLVISRLRSTVVGGSDGPRGIVLAGGASACVCVCVCAPRVDIKADR